MNEETKNIAKGVTLAVLNLVAIGVGLYGLMLLKSVITYILIAVVVALIGSPIVRFLKTKLKMSAGWAVAVVMGAIVTITGGIFSMFIPLIVSQSKSFSEIDFAKLQRDLIEYARFLSNKTGIKFSEKVASGIGDIFNFEDIYNVLNSVIVALGDISVGFFSVLFIAFFFLRDGNKIINSFLILMDRKYLTRTRGAIRQIKYLLSRYFLGLVIQVTTSFVILSIVLLLAGVKNALTIAFLCALMDLIPYLGNVVGIVLISALTMTNFINEDFMSVILPKTAFVLIGHIVAQLVDNFISQPLIFSKSVKSNPLEIFFVILASGVLFGVMGMIFAVPMYTVIKVVLKVSFSESKIVRILTKNL